MAQGGGASPCGQLPLAALRRKFKQVSSVLLAWIRGAGSLKRLSGRRDLAPFQGIEQVP